VPVSCGRRTKSIGSATSSCQRGCSARQSLVKTNKMLNGSNHSHFHTLNFMRRICDYAWRSVRGIAEVLASFVGARGLLPVRVPVAMLCTVNFAAALCKIVALEQKPGERSC
jgi:hypothetical protein